jgi:hypothetical protein
MWGVVVGQVEDDLDGCLASWARSGPTAERDSGWGDRAMPLTTRDPGRGIKNPAYWRGTVGPGAMAIVAGVVITARRETGPLSRSASLSQSPCSVSRDRGAGR